MSTYKEIYGVEFEGRTNIGVELEIIFHMYMYYFDLDSSTNYRSSKEIDIDIVNQKSKGNGRYFELKYVIKMAPKLISICKNSIIQGKQNTVISSFIYAYVLATKL